MSLLDAADETLAAAQRGDGEAFRRPDADPAAVATSRDGVALGDVRAVEMAAGAERHRTALEIFDGVRNP